MQIKARAKINLFFHITKKREDGYHLIESLMVFADDVYDIIEITEADKNSTSIMGGEFASLLIDEKNNLIDKALNAFTINTKYHCSLIKNIPIGAGLGGGSSDAAMVAKFLTNEDISAELLKIGADLPICYHNAPAFCSGIGEIIKPIKNFPKLHLVLVNPGKALLTKDVFKNFSIAPQYSSHLEITDNYSFEELVEFITPLGNSLSKTAIELMPEIQEILNLLDSQKNCLVSRMSGSGPTCFGIFNNAESAMKAQANIATLYPNYWVKYTSA